MPARGVRRQAFTTGLPCGLCGCSRKTPAFPLSFLPQLVKPFTTKFCFSLGFLMAQEKTRSRRHSSGVSSPPHNAENVLALLKPWNTKVACQPLPLGNGCMLKGREELMWLTRSCPLCSRTWTETIYLISLHNNEGPTLHSERLFIQSPPSAPLLENGS